MNFSFLRSKMESPLSLPTHICLSWFSAMQYITCPSDGMDGSRHTVMFLPS